MTNWSDFGLRPADLTRSDFTSSFDNSLKAGKFIANGSSI
jgi:hypothetical protein